MQAFWWCNYNSFIELLPLWCLFYHITILKLVLQTHPRGLKSCCDLYCPCNCNSGTMRDTIRPNWKEFCWGCAWDRRRQDSFLLSRLFQKLAGMKGMCSSAVSTQETNQIGRDFLWQKAEKSTAKDELEKLQQQSNSSTWVKHWSTQGEKKSNKPFFTALRGLPSFAAVDGLAPSSPVSLPLDCSLAVDSASDGEILPQT